jgi:hypothetical protein
MPILPNAPMICAVIRYLKMSKIAPDFRGLLGGFTARPLGGFDAKKRS